MKLSVLVVSMLLCLSITANADQRLLKKPFICYDKDTMVKTMAKYDEKVVFVDENIMTNKSSTIILTRNDWTGTWTLYELVKGYACIMGTGQGGPAT